MRKLIKIWIYAVCLIVACNSSYAQVADLSEMTLQPCEIVNEQLKEYIQNKFIPEVLKRNNNQVDSNLYFYGELYSSKSNSEDKINVSLFCLNLPPERVLFHRRSHASFPKNKLYTVIDGITFELYTFSEIPESFIKPISGDSLIVNYIKGKRRLVPTGGKRFDVKLIFRDGILIDQEVHDHMGYAKRGNRRVQNKNVAMTSLSSCEIVNDSLKEFLINKYIPVISAPINQIGDYYTYITCERVGRDNISVNVTYHRIDENEQPNDRKKLVSKYKYRYYTILDGVTFEIYSDTPDCFIKRDNGDNRSVEYSTVETMPFTDDRFYEVKFEFDGDNLLNYKVNDFMGLEKFYYYLW